LLGTPSCTIDEPSIPSICQTSSQKTRSPWTFSYMGRAYVEFGSRQYPPLNGDSTVTTLQYFVLNASAMGAAVSANVETTNSSTPGHWIPLSKEPTARAMRVILETYFDAIVSHGDWLLLGSSTEITTVIRLRSRSESSQNTL